MSEDKPKRGTAAMSEATRREVCRKGGLKISQDRAYMSALGKKGGAKVSQDREYMSRLGKKGGAKTQEKFRQQRLSLETDANKKA